VAVLASATTVLTTVSAFANNVANSLVGVLGESHTYIVNSTNSLFHNLSRATEHTVAYITSCREKVVERGIYAAE
jgi:hypothetical protein